MKVLDIISEAPNIGPTTTTPSGIIVPQSAVTPPAPKANPKPLSYKDLKSVQDRAATISKRFDKVNPTSLTGKFVKGLRQKVAMSKLAKDFSFEKIGDAMQADKNFAAKMMKVNKNIIAPMRYALRVVGILTTMYDYYVITSLIETAYQSGDLKEDEFKDAIAAANGLLTVQLTANIVNIAKQASLVRWLVRIIAWITGGVSATFSMGAGIAAALATDVFITWFTYWVGTNEGQHWLLHSWFTPFVMGFGHVESKVWDSLTGYFNKQKDKQLDKQDPAGAPARKANAAAAEKDKEAGEKLADKLVFERR